MLLVAHGLYDTDFILQIFRDGANDHLVLSCATFERHYRLPELLPRLHSSAGPMPTVCSAEQFEFEGLGRRRVVAAFDGGAVTSDAGGLLLRHTNRGDRADRAGGGVLCGSPRAGASRAQHADLGRAADRRHCLGLRGCERPRRAAPRPGARPVRRPARAEALGLRAARRKEHAQSPRARAAPARRPLPQDRPRPRRDRPSGSSTCSSKPTSGRQSRSSSTWMPPTIRCTGSRKGDSSMAITAATAICRCTCSVAGACWRPRCGPRTSLGRRNGVGAPFPQPSGQAAGAVEEVARRP